MFTGIVQDVGTVLTRHESAIEIKSSPLDDNSPDPLQLGESIAVNGVDLTVRHLDGTSFWANIMPETFRRTNLGDCPGLALRSTWSDQCVLPTGSLGTSCAVLSRDAPY